MKFHFFHVIICFSFISNAIAMEKQVPYIYMSTGQSMYIGNCETRNTLEKVYDTTFPINAVFCAMVFKNTPYDHRDPEFIPYDLIKDCKENETITLTLYGKSYAFLCKQENARDRFPTSFEDAVQTSYKRFLDHANCLLEGEESLIQEKVIKTSETKYYHVVEHGENAAPAVLEKFKK